LKNNTKRSDKENEFMAKLPYEKPVIVHEEAIQTVAGNCDAGFGDPSCTVNGSGS
jgi:hypothetical protein